MKEKKKNEADSREQLIEAGIELFARDGIDGTTVRDIAKHAGTNLCMVSYHFDGKEGLYRACLEKYGKQKVENFKNLTSNAKNMAEFEFRLQGIVTHIAMANSENKNLLKILLREMEHGLPNAKDVYEKTFLKVMKDLREFFAQAQKQGFVREDLCPTLLAVSIHGAVGYMFRFEAVTKKYFNRSVHDEGCIQEVIQNIVTVFLNGIKKEGANL